MLYMAIFFGTTLLFFIPDTYMSVQFLGTRISSLKSQGLMAKSQKQKKQIKKPNNNHHNNKKHLGRKNSRLV